MKQYLQYIESRAINRYREKNNLPLLKKENIYRDLLQYKGKNLFASFTAIDKIGVNPKNIYSTPHGIYTYPVDFLIDHTESINDYEIKDYKTIHAPFASQHPFLWVIEPKGRGIDDLFLYSSRDFDTDIRKLKKAFDPDWVNFLSKKAITSSYVQNPGGMMWYITMVLSEVPSEEYFHKNYNDVFDPLNNETFWKHEIYGNPAKWNRILSKILGYDYIADYGQGVIHNAEPHQAVFLNINSYNVVDKLVQDLSRRNVYGKKIEEPKIIKKVEPDDIDDANWFKKL